jgi:hypothetical protein
MKTRKIKNLLINSIYMSGAIVDYLDYKIHDSESFKKNVPIREYEHFEPYINRILEGENNVLTAEDIILFEPTGGGLYRYW